MRVSGKGDSPKVWCAPSVVLTKSEADSLARIQDQVEPDLSIGNLQFVAGSIQLEQVIVVG